MDAGSPAPFGRRASLRVTHKIWLKLASWRKARLVAAAQTGADRLIAAAASPAPPGQASLQPLITLERGATSAGLRRGLTAALTATRA